MEKGKGRDQYEYSDSELNGKNKWLIEGTATINNKADTSCNCRQIDLPVA